VPSRRRWAFVGDLVVGDLAMEDLVVAFAKDLEH